MFSNWLKCLWRNSFKVSGRDATVNQTRPFFLVSRSQTAILPPLFYYDVIGRQNRVWWSSTARVVLLHRVSVDRIPLANNTLAWQSMISPQIMHIQSLSRRGYLVSRLLRNAKESAFALKDFLAFLTRKTENTTDVYHFLKLYYADVP